MTKIKISRYFIPFVFVLSIYRNHMSRFNFPRWLQIGPYLFGVIGMFLLFVLGMIREYGFPKKESIKALVNRWTIVGSCITIFVHTSLFLQLIRGQKNIFQLIDFVVYDLAFLFLLIICVMNKENEIIEGFTLLFYELMVFAIYGWVRYILKYDISVIGGLDGNPQPAGMIYLMAIWFPLNIKNKKMEAMMRLFLLITAAFSFQKSVWLGIVFSIGLYMIKRKEEIRKELKLKMFLVIPVVLAICFIISGVRKMIIAKITGSVFSISARLVAWKYCLGYYNSNMNILQKIVGIGFDTADDLANESGLYYAEDFPVSAVDNQFITLLLEFGVFGIITVILWFVVSYKQIGKGRMKSLGILVTAMFFPFMFYDLLVRRQAAVILVMVSAVLFYMVISDKSKNGSQIDQDNLKKIERDSLDAF